jgi:single-strand DNA-binding protein
MYNKIILLGNTTRDVDLRYLTNGTAVANFGIATNRKFKSADGTEKDETMFIDVTVFGRTAEIVNQYVKKGDRLFIEGRLVLEQWTDNNGNKRSKHSVTAEKVQFLSCKSSNGEASKSQNYGNNAAKIYNQSSNGEANLPSIDVNDDEIPF